MTLFISLLLAFPIAMAIGALIAKDDFAFMQGLKAAALAAVATLALGLFFPYHVAIAPALEEAARLLLIAKSAFLLTSPRAWLLFGLGFGLPEGISKLFRGAVTVTSGGELSFLTNVGPIVPVLMHVALSVLACALIRAGWRWPFVLALTFAIHFLHNWSLYEIVRGDPVNVALSRLMTFGFILAVTLEWARRFTMRPASATRTS